MLKVAELQAENQDDTNQDGDDEGLWLLELIEQVLYWGLLLSKLAFVAVFDVCVFHLDR